MSSLFTTVPVFFSRVGIEGLLSTERKAIKDTTSQFFFDWVLRYEYKQQLYLKMKEIKSLLNDNGTELLFIIS